jgi:hypothetical protein
MGRGGRHIKVEWADRTSWGRITCSRGGERVYAQVAEEVEAAYYNQKCDEAEAKDQLFSQAADEAEATYYKGNAEKCDAGPCSKWNEVVVKDCVTDDSDDELLIDCDYDWTS